MKGGGVFVFRFFSIVGILALLGLFFYGQISHTEDVDVRSVAVMAQ
jgi:hypothetical protein